MKLLCNNCHICANHRGSGKNLFTAEDAKDAEERQKHGGSLCVLCGKNDFVILVATIGRAKKWLLGALALFLWSFGALAGDFPARDFPSNVAVFAATFDDLNGQPVALAGFKGKPLVLNFWATWCPPCRKEIPDLMEVHNRYGARGVAVIGVAVEEVARVPEFVKANNINYPILVGRDKGIELLQALGNKSAGLPYAVVLDRQGNIVFTKRGALTRERLEQVLEPLL